ncbi:MAG TPA: lipid II flippase MurJ [Chloroflexota bacterium]
MPITLFSLIAGGALSSAMIPVLLSTTSRDGEEAARRLTNLVLNLLLGAFAVLVLLGGLLTPGFVSHVLAPGFDGKTSQLTVDLTRIMLIQPVILAVGSVITAVLNSRNQFLLTGVSVATHNTGLIIGIMAARLHPTLGIYGPTAGVVLGAILQVLILVPGMTGSAFQYHPLFNFADSRLREVIALLIPNGLAVGVMYTGFIVDTAFASNSREAAALPAIHNAFLLVALPIALLGQAIGQSVFPRLAAYADNRDWLRMRGSLVRAVLTVVVLAVPMVLGWIVLGRPTIRVLFEHGRFGSSAGRLTYDVLVAYSIALPAYVATEVLTRGLIALRDTRTPLLTNTAQIIGGFFFMALLIGSVGVLAVPRSFAVMATLETVALATVLAVELQRRIHSLTRASARSTA